ncbi:MAG: primosomal protein N', partial [Flavobacteriaceae bacterium]|nr:primosomal protein N' [Flavobacteriaceae bacterium]
MPYVDVILPLALDRLYTYSVSREQAGILRPGMRIAVPFKRSKLYTALVHSLHEEAPQGYEARPIDQVLDEEPLANEKHLTFWQWIASYYMCTLGDVMRTALPGAFMLQSETVILPAVKEIVDEQALTDNEFLIFEALQNNNALKVADIQRILERKTVLPVLQTMMSEGLIQMQEKIQERYRPKWIKYIRVIPDYQKDDGLASVLEQLSRAEKQKALLMHYFQLADGPNEWLSSTELLKSSGISAAVRNALVDKGIMEEKKVREDRLNTELHAELASEIDLNPQQSEALGATEKQLKEGQVVLLHGVTASGKTEIYVKLAQEALERGEQVLYMVPEIALTAQLITRLQKHFGESISVYHSRYSVHERVETWNNVLRESPKAGVILGTRSSLFLPFQKLGLIIVDEEHDPSYKQFDPAPRYHGRDAAVVLAKALQSQIVLGSATPSVTSFNNHISGKYGYAQIPDRYKEILMPEVHLVDLREQHRKKIIKGHFSLPLLEAIHETLTNEEQVILFQNRRGYSPIVECKTCGHIP